MLLKKTFSSIYLDKRIMNRGKLKLKLYRFKKFNNIKLSETMRKFKLKIKFIIKQKF
jgi:hypothetical protein